MVCRLADKGAHVSAQRMSKRAAALGRKRYSDYEYDIDLEEDDSAQSPHESSSPKRFRHTRFTTEDRRFGACSPLAAAKEERRTTSEI